MITINPLKGLVPLAILLLVAGLVMGFRGPNLGAAGARLDDPIRRQADEQARHQARLNALEEQRLSDELQLELQYLRRKMELRLSLLRIGEYVLMGAGALALVVVLAICAVYLCRLAYRQQNIAQRFTSSGTDQSEGLWERPSYRAARIQLARANEWLFRESCQSPSSGKRMRHGSPLRLVPSEQPATIHHGNGLLHKEPAHTIRGHRTRRTP